ncbi:hypothetical protein [Pseudomonas sp. UV AK001]|uniref:glycosyltransferase family 39 protein n=1 Tax=Pseudomonas sp. UV AK001 TaxID=3384791 RepID=UPI0038D4F924
MKGASAVAATAGRSSWRVDRLALLAVVCLALIVRFHAIDVSSLWYDEAYSLVLARETPARIWALTALDVHPPLYYVLLHYWVLLWGEGALPARALSALVDVGTVLLCIKLMSLIATRRATWMAAVLLALLPISVRYSQEARMYTLLGFWLMGATVALVCWCNSPGRMRYPVIYVLLMTAAFYTHYLAALCVLTHWLFWWRSHRQESLVLSAGRWVMANGAIVLLFIPWLPSVFDQLAGKPYFGWIEPFTWRFVLLLVWQLTDGNEATNLLWQVWLALLLLASVLSILSRPAKASRYNVLLLGYFFVPTGVLLFIAVTTPTFVPRYFQFAAIGIPLMLAVALDDRWRSSRLLCAGVLACFLFGELYGLAALTKVREANGRPDLLASGIQTQSQQGDVIVVENLFWYFPFTLYNHTGISPRIYVGSFATKLWGYPDRSGWALVAQPDQSILGDDSLTELKAKRVWWITHTQKAEDLSLVSHRWKRAQTLSGGVIEARLFIAQ